MTHFILMIIVLAACFLAMALSLALEWYKKAAQAGNAEAAKAVERLTSP